MSCNICFTSDDTLLVKPCSTCIGVDGNTCVSCLADMINNKTVKLQNRYGVAVTSKYLVDEQPDKFLMECVLCKQFSSVYNDKLKIEKSRYVVPYGKMINKFVNMHLKDISAILIILYYTVVEPYLDASFVAAKTDVDYYSVRLYAIYAMCVAGVNMYKRWLRQPYITYYMFPTIYFAISIRCYGACLCDIKDELERWYPNHKMFMPLLQEDICWADIIFLILFTAASVFVHHNQYWYYYALVSYTLFLYKKFKHTYKQDRQNFNSKVTIIKL